MKEFLDLFKAIAENEETAKSIKDSINKAREGLDMIQGWIAKVPEDKFSEAMKTVSEKSRKNLADAVRCGKVDREFLKKVHRIKMMFPSDITRRFEEIFNEYYDEYSGGTK
jgi:uncharacterized radical SAM superfamily protein